MKRLKVLLVLILAFFLTGCVQKYDFSGEQSNAVAEYMAGKLLEYDEDYDQQLTPDEDLATEDLKDDSSDVNGKEPTKTPKTNENGQTATVASTEDATNEYTLSEVIGIKNLDVQYSGYRLATSYPDEEDNPYFSLTARADYQLLVVSFGVQNTSDSKKELNLAKTDIVYQLDINVGTIYKPQFTLLENDLRYMNEAIKAKEMQTALLVFEIPKAADLSSINLKITKEDKTNTVKIK